MKIFKDIVSGDCVLDDTRTLRPLTLKTAGASSEIPGAFAVQAKFVVKPEADGTQSLVCDILDKDVGFGYLGPQTYSKADFDDRIRTWCRVTKEKIESTGGKSMDFLVTAKLFFAAYREIFAEAQIFHPRGGNEDALIFGFWDDEARAIGCPKFAFLMPTLISSE